MGKWQIVYLRNRYRSKLGWFFLFGPIHVSIRHNLEIELTILGITESLNKAFPRLCELAPAGRRGITQPRKHLFEVLCTSNLVCVIDVR